ncbi:esterase [Caballeronia calidae]|uniref:Esterase n=1 Tax=Caballeronia calidae TaxID=1777139 RepID=A0A158DUZ4_9BURK|nr:alpha/beta hydrolase family protein [Caballeronia calidae]SAK98442.1 esterase [Caballeronia calidae]
MASPNTSIKSATREFAAPRRTYVLVHGAYHGGWCWKEVASILRSKGHVVYTPTLTGLGERSHLIDCRPTLEVMIKDVEQVFFYEELEDVILVGHSFAGSIVSALADRMPERLRHLVYLDAQVLESGQAPLDAVPPSIREKYLQRARDCNSTGHAVPPGDPETFGINDPSLVERVRGLLTPHPFGAYFDKLMLNHPLGNGVSATYVVCTSPLHPNTSHSRNVAKAQPGWDYVELAAGHDAMLTRPSEVARLIEQVS